MRTRDDGCGVVFSDGGFEEGGDIRSSVDDGVGGLLGKDMVIC